MSPSNFVLLCVPERLSVDELLSPIPEEYYPAGLSDNITPRVASFKEEPYSTSLPKDKRSNPLSIAIPLPPHHLPDLSPLIIPGRGDSEVDRVGAVIRDIARPHSTPPRLWALRSATRILEVCLLLRLIILARD